MLACVEEEGWKGGVRWEVGWSEWEIAETSLMLHCIGTGCLLQQSARCESHRISGETILQQGGLTAMVFSLGCQLACRIFLLKSSVSKAMFSRIPPGRIPFFMPALLPGRGPPIFFALNADLSACSTTSFNVSPSNIRK